MCWPSHSEIGFPVTFLATFIFQVVPPGTLFVLVNGERVFKLWHEIDIELLVLRAAVERPDH